MADFRAQLARIKKATVAVAFMHDDDKIGPPPHRNAPFTILGSGFCVHEKGIIITCKHVMEAFMEHSIEKQLATMAKNNPTLNLRGASVKTIHPFALFYIPESEQHIVVACVGVRTMNAKTDSPMDIGVL